MKGELLLLLGRGTAAGARVGWRELPVWLKGRAHRYRRVMGWLVKDSLLRFWVLCGASLLLGWIGLSMQIGAIGLAARYAHLLEKGRPMRILGTAFDPRSSIELLVLVGTCAALLLIGGAVATWCAGVCGMRLRRRYQEFCALRAFGHLGESFVAWPKPGAAETGMTAIIRLVRGDSGYAGRVAQLLLSMVVPALTTVVAVGALFWLEPLLSLGVFALVLLSAAFLVRINIRAAECSRTMEEAALEAAREMRQSLGFVRDSPLEITPANGGVSVTGPAFTKYLNARDGRMLMVETGRLVSNVTFAAAVFAVLLVLGGSLLREGTGFSRLVIYLVALRAALSSFRTVMQLLISINRFFPQLSRYFEFLETASGAARDPARLERRRTWTLRTYEPRLSGSLTEVVVSPPRCVALLAPSEVNRYTLGYLVAMLFGGRREDVAQALADATFAALRVDPGPATTWREALGLPPAWDRRAVLELLGEGPEVEALREALPEDLSSPCNEQVWRSLPRAAKFALSLPAAVARPAQWVFLDGRHFARLSEGTRRAVLAHLGDRIAVIVSPETDQIPAFAPDVVAVGAEGRLYGLGDSAWFREVIDEIEVRFGEVLRGTAGEGATELEDEDLELLEV